MTDGGLTHLDASGTARMVDVADKPATARVAVAQAVVRVSAETAAKVAAGDMKKGDVIGVARIAGIQAAKKTSELIPLCHPLALDRIQVELELVEAWPGVRVTATVAATARTGVEMEALTAVSVACLTVYDMVKAVDRTMRITGLRLLEKTGGARGDWRATNQPAEEEEES